MANYNFSENIDQKIDEVKHRYAGKNLKDLKLKSVSKMAKALDKVMQEDDSAISRMGYLHNYLDNLLKDEQNIDFFKAYELYKQNVEPVETFLVIKHHYRTNGHFSFDGLIGLFFDFILFIFTDWHSKIYYIPICILIMLVYSFFHHLKEKKKGKVLNF
jgi:hypothetical protein